MSGGEWRRLFTQLAQLAKSFYWTRGSHGALSYGMSRVTKFGVLPILRGLEGKFSPLRVMHARSADEAKRKADVFAMVIGGAVAFSKSGDPDRNQWGDTVILGCCGEVPEGIKTTGLRSAGFID